MKIEEVAKMDWKDLVRSVSNGWGVGDTAWYVYKVNRYYECETCNGERYVKASFRDRGEIDITCPDCRGMGGEFYNPTYTPQSFEVRMIRLVALKSGIINEGESPMGGPEGVYQITDGESHFYPCDVIYHTEEECRKKCEELSELYRERAEAKRKEPALLRWDRNGSI